MALEFDRLSRRYGDLVALDDLSFTVPTGEVVGFLGPNGSGKTTTMRAVFGLVALDSGSVSWNGRLVDATNRRRFGYMPEERGLYPGMAVGEQLQYLARLHGLGSADARSATRRWLERFDVADRADSKVETLSLGNQQRVQLAAALVHGPELLILDEPLSGLDPVGIDAVGAVLTEQAAEGRGVLFSSHQLDLVEDLCASVAIIDHGRLVARGTVEELATSGSRRLVVQVGGDRAGAWARDLPGTHVSRVDGGAVRLTLDDGADAQGVLAIAMRAGPVLQFGFERRRLSEVFRESLTAGAGVSSMAPYVILAVALVLGALRRWRRSRGGGAPKTARGSGVTLPRRLRGGVALVAAREIRERTRGRVFRVGTLIILLAIAAAIVIPALDNGSGSSSEDVGVIGTVSAPLRASIVALGPPVGATVTVTTEPDIAAARKALVAGQVDIVLLGTSAILVKTTPGADDTSTTTQLAQTLAVTVSLQTNLQASGLSAQQAAALTHPTPLPITGLRPAPKPQTGQTVTVYGLILLFVLLGQYGTWILLGVVEEKSSRVVEVLLAALRPRQLLAGKVLGIGMVALIQAALILAVALGLSAAVGSDLLKGSNPTNVLATLVWLVLGYVFYCWIYAAAGSLATRQEHIQTLAFPLQLPLLLGYITSLTALTSGHASGFVHVLAYVPLTAPFAMPVLVALDQVTWWQFLISVALSMIATAAVARGASTIYVRAILRTGQRVRLQDIVADKAATRPLRSVP